MSDGSIQRLKQLAAKFGGIFSSNYDNETDHWFYVWNWAELIMASDDPVFHKLQLEISETWLVPGSCSYIEQEF